MTDRIETTVLEREIARAQAELDARVVDCRRCQRARGLCRLHEEEQTELRESGAAALRIARAALGDHPRPLGVTPEAAAPSRK